MKEKISERYQKALVTVAMGFRTVDEIHKNGLYIFTKSQKHMLIKYIQSLFEKNQTLLLLKVKSTGYHSAHVVVTTKSELEDFIKEIGNIYKTYAEIWVVSSSTIHCWRCRISLSSNHSDIIEMAYSRDDHILDHLSSELKIPYICYRKKGNSFSILNTNLAEGKIDTTKFFIHDIFSKYSEKFQQIKKDLEIMKIDSICLDVRINNGYDFHDFDITYNDTWKVISYYLPKLNCHDIDL